MEKNFINELAELLERFRSLRVSPSSIAPEDMTRLLDGLSEVKEWIEMVEGEALHMLESGTPIKGYKIRYREYRRISDESAAIGALRKYDPDAAKLCVTERIRNINSIKKIIGKKAFEEILGQYTNTVRTSVLTKQPK